jgi:hypothetical protein
MTDDRLLEEWRKRLASFVPGQQTVREWCQQQGITQDRFYFWQRKLRARVQATTSSPSPKQWLPVEFTDDRTTQRVKSTRSAAALTPQLTQSSLTVKVGGAAIDVRPGFDACLLRAVVCALEAEPC